MNRIVSGKIKLDLQLLDIAALVEAAVDTLRPLADTKAIGMAIADHAVAGLRVRGDAVRVQQIFVNLLTNALKFTHSGGRIDIAIRSPASGAIEVEVRDDGEGIDPAFIAHLFERFSQANSKAARVHGGLGIGLSIVKQMTELHGGTVTAVSGGVGHGATFRVVLPTVPEGPAAACGAGPHDDHIDLRGISVLLVDDHADILELSRRLLAECGASVVTVSSAAAALAHLRTATVDVLVSDISMPQMNGYDLIGEVRAGLALDARQLPAVAVSAFARLQDQQKAFDAGFQAYVVKPIVPHLLLRAVATLAALPAPRGATVPHTPN